MATQSHAVERSRLYAWFVVGALWVVVSLNYMDRQALFSVSPLLRREIGASNASLGLMGSAFLWVYGGVSPFAGYVGDVFQRRTVILLSLILWSLVTFATGLSTTAAGLIVLRGLMGISEACYMPAGLAMIADYHGSRHRSFAVALHQSGVYVGTIAGGVFAGYMGDHLGWRHAFYYLGLYGVLLAIVLAFVLHDALRAKSESATKEEPTSLRSNYAALLRTPTVLIQCAVVMTFSVYFWMLMAWLPLFFYQEFAMNLTHAAFTATAYTQTASVTGILVGGVLADYFRQNHLCARMWVQFVGIIAAAPFLLLLGSSRSLLLVVLALIVYGFGRGMWDCNNMPVLCDVAPPKMRASTYGLFNSAGMLGGGVGTLAVGVLVPRLKLRTVISSTALLAVLAGILLWIGATKFLESDMRKLELKCEPAP